MFVMAKCVPGVMLSSEENKLVLHVSGVISPEAVPFRESPESILLLTLRPVLFFHWIPSKASN